MLTKLLKYELKAAGRQILPICVVMPAWSAVARLLIMMRGSLPWPQVEQVLNGLLVTGCALILFGGFCVAWVFLMLRYYRGFYGGEGYLIHMLPTTAGNLLWAKLLAAVLWQLVVWLSVAVSLLLLTAGTEFAQIVLQVCGIVWENAAEQLAGGIFAVLLFELAVLIPLSAVSGFLMVYAAISLGQRMRENRVLGAVAAYIGLSFGVSAVFGVFNSVTSSVALQLAEAAPGLVFVLLIGIQVVLVLAECVGAFFFCRWSLEKKLELT